MSTPAGKSILIRASTVFGVGTRISISLLCVLISNCSRESLYLWGARRIVITSFLSAAVLVLKPLRLSFLRCPQFSQLIGLKPDDQRPSTEYEFFVCSPYICLLTRALTILISRLKHYTVFAGTLIRFCNDATSVFLYTQPGVSCLLILKTQDKQAITLAKPGPCSKLTLRAKTHSSRMYSDLSPGFSESDILH